MAPHGKLSRCLDSGSAKVLRLVFAEGSDAHVLCRGAFSFPSSLMHFCPAAAGSRASIFKKLDCGLGEMGREGFGKGRWTGRCVEGYKVPKLLSMVAEQVANKFTEEGGTHPLLKYTDCRTRIESQKGSFSGHQKRFSFAIVWTKLFGEMNS